MSEIQKIGPYKLTRLIGKGGMGRVYEAINEQIQRRVAIKVLHSQFAENAMVVQRFINEARAVNIVKHRCLVDIYEFGQLEDGGAYIVMEYLEGDTLHERLWKEGGKLTTALAMRIARQIALALAAAHAKDIIHRDLKPANIMLVEDAETGAHDWVKVLDFGLARVREPTEEAGRLTQTGVVMGTPSYMSPEQIRSARSVTDRSDVYTLGVMLYEMLAGVKPFTSASDAEVMFMHMSTEPKPITDIAPGLPQLLVELVHGMLKKNPVDRPTAVMVASVIARITGSTSTALPVLSGMREFSGPVPIDPNETQPMATGGIPAAQSTAGGAAAQKSSRPGVRSSRTRLFVGAALGLLLVSGGGLALLRLSRPTPAPRVSWSLRSVPAGAEVVGDNGQVLGVTPFASQHPKSAGAQTLLLRLKGYNEARVTCDGSADCERETVLVAQPPPPPVAPPVSPQPEPEVKTPAGKSPGGKTPGKTKPEGGKKKAGKKGKKGR